MVRLGWKNKENPRENRLGWFCGTYCTVILRYSLELCVFSEILWSSCFECYGPKDTRYKRGRFYSVGITVNIYKNLESFPNMRLSFTNLWLETICQILFLSLWRNKTQSISSKMGELTASLSLAERWTTTEIFRQLNSVPDEFPDHKCPTSFYKVFFFLFK